MRSGIGLNGVSEGEECMVWAWLVERDTLDNSGKGVRTVGTVELRYGLMINLSNGSFNLDMSRVMFRVKQHFRLV